MSDKQESGSADITQVEPDFQLTSPDFETSNYCLGCRKWKSIESFTIAASGHVLTMCDHCRLLRKAERKKNGYTRIKHYERNRVEKAETNGLRHCKDCLRDLPDEHFRQRANGIFNKHCKECCKKRAEYVGHPDRASRYQQRHSERLRKMREDVIDHYGGRCNCCGETEKTFLQLDHIKDDGRRHRAEIGDGGTALVQWLHSNNYPHGIVQVLCANCNTAKARGCWPCPHHRLNDAHPIDKALDKFKFEGSIN